MNFVATNAKPDRKPNIPNGLTMSLIVQYCKHVLSICTELANNQALLDGNHSEQVGQQVITTKETHVRPHVLKIFYSQQVLCFIRTLGTNICDELRHYFFRLHS